MLNDAHQLDRPEKSHRTGQFTADGGMLLVLVLLVIAFSLLTLKPQTPGGAAAGVEVATKILRRFGHEGKFIIVAAAGRADEEFTTAALATLTAAGVTDVHIARGSPAAARKAFSEHRDAIAVAVTGSAARWDVVRAGSLLPAERLTSPRERLWPDFLKLDNLLGVSAQTAIYALIAIGMTMVVILREIDLSVGSLVALASVTATVFIRDVGGGATASGLMVFIGCLLALVVCGSAGAVSGLLLTRARLPSFLVTLAMMLIARGLAQRISRQESINQLPPVFREAGGGSLAGIPNPIWLMLLLYAVAHFVMSRTVFGRMLYAIGGNPEAARLCGIPINRIRTSVFILSGVLAGFGGLLLSSRLNAGDPKYGEMYELEVIAAVVVGGTSLMGGEGRMTGTLTGAFIIAVIRNGMNLLGVESSNQKIVLGAVLLAAVLADQIKRDWQQRRERG
ncbi:MAG: ABC transporter permease [Planctomycetota bacterium]